MIFVYSKEIFNELKYSALTTIIEKHHELLKLSEKTLKHKIHNLIHYP